MLLTKLYWIENKTSESINETDTEYVSVEDPLTMHRTASNGTTLVSNCTSEKKNQLQF